MNFVSVVKIGEVFLGPNFCDLLIYFLSWGVGGGGRSFIVFLILNNDRNSRYISHMYHEFVKVE